MNNISTSMRALTFMIASAVSLSSSAEPALYDVKNLERADSVSLRPENKQYPPELAKTGVQGEVLVVVPLTDEGKSDGASLGESSGSAKLDEVAVDLVKTFKFHVKEAPAKGWKAIVVPVEFYKDSVSTLANKTCADFNVDLAYFQSNYPAAKVSKMRVFEMSTGVLYMTSGGNVSKAAALAKKTGAALQPTIDSCRLNPDAKFFETWTNAVKSA
ncbi:MAG: TonB family protein [Telluria sp.]